MRQVAVRRGSALPEPPRRIPLHWSSGAAYRVNRVAVSTDKAPAALPRGLLVSIEAIAVAPES